MKPNKNDTLQGILNALEKAPKVFIIKEFKNNLKIKWEINKRQAKNLLAKTEEPEKTFIISLDSNKNLYFK